MFRKYLEGWKIGIENSIILKILFKNELSKNKCGGGRGGNAGRSFHPAGIWQSKPAIH